MFVATEISIVMTDHLLPIYSHIINLFALRYINNFVRILQFILYMINVTRNLTSEFTRDIKFRQA